MTHNAKVGGEEVTFEANAFNTLEEAVEAYGSEVVYSLYRQKFIISARGVFTTAYDKAIADGEDHETAVTTAQGKVASWKPGQSPVRKSKEDKAFDAIMDLDDEAIARLEEKQGYPEGSLKEIRDGARAKNGWIAKEA